MNDLGYSEVLDKETATIARGMRPEHLPPEEVELLRRLGFPVAAEQLPGMPYLVKMHSETQGRQSEGMRPSTVMSQAVEQVNSARTDHKRLEEIESELRDLEQREETDSRATQQLEEERESRRRPRRCWKGLRKIIVGAATSLADVGIAVGVGSTVAPPAYATLVSVVCGVDIVLDGLEELRRR
jgi:hypothetical protein